MRALDQLNIFCNRPQQSWDAVQHFEHNGHKLRFRIRKGAYDSTSHAVVDVQDKSNLQWNVLASIPPIQMKSDMCYACEDINHRANRPSSMTLDLKELIKKAEMLV